MSCLIIILSWDYCQRTKFKRRPVIAAVASEVHSTGESSSSAATSRPPPSVAEILNKYLGQDSPLAAAQERSKVREMLSAVDEASAARDDMTQVICSVCLVCTTRCVMIIFLNANISPPPLIPCMQFIDEYHFHPYLRSDVYERHKVCDIYIYFF